jgi:hypothetical protein
MKISMAFPSLSLKPGQICHKSIRSNLSGPMFRWETEKYGTKPNKKTKNAIKIST